jgi:hypothetical protein
VYTNNAFLKLFLNRVSLLGRIDFTSPNIVALLRQNEPNDNDLTQVLKLTKGSEKIPFDTN